MMAHLRINMKSYLFLGLLLLGLGANAQRYKSSSSSIRFYSSAPLEDIEATTIEATSILDLSNQAIVFAVPINTFQFKKKLMQEHFNENYLESDKYPKAYFKGVIKDWNGSNGESEAVAVGEMEIHGQTQQVEIPGTITNSNGQLSLASVFMIKLKDYKVKIPKAVFYNIAEEVEVTIKFDYEALKEN